MLSKTLSIHRGGFNLSPCLENSDDAVMLTNRSISKAMFVCYDSFYNFLLSHWNELQGLKELKEAKE